MTDLEKRIMENQEEYNQLFLRLADKYRHTEVSKDRPSLYESIKSSEIDDLLKSISVVKNNLEVLKGIESYLAEEEKKIYGRH